MKKHVAFDFDGTLVDTKGLILDSWQHLFNLYTGGPGDEQEIYDTYGETLAYTINKFFPDADQVEALRKYRSYQNEHYKGAIKVFPGMLDVIKQIREMGLSTSIVTSRTRLTTREYMETLGIRELFDVVVTCNDVKEHKPDPHSLLKALDAVGVEPQDAIMLGDTKFDMGCAKNAGVTSVLVGWSDADRTEMDEYGYTPDYIIETADEILELIR